jgi:peptidoglycan hydrolase-like protein with peptidoglycan-binding domain
MQNKFQSKLIVSGFMLLTAVSLASASPDDDHGMNGRGNDDYVRRPIPVLATSTMPFGTNTPMLDNCMNLRNLKQGERDSNKIDKEIMKLQNKLVKMGYLSGTTTGYFGAQTKLAVMKFQKENGLPQIGQLGPTTRAKLDDKFCKGGMSKGNDDRRDVIGEQKFRLTSYKGSTTPTSTLGMVTLHIERGTELHAKVCNNINGKISPMFTPTSTTLTATNTMSTMMDCVDPLVTEMESQFVTGLNTGFTASLASSTYATTTINWNGTTTVNVIKHTLSLTNKSGVAFVFESKPEMKK